MSVAYFTTKSSQKKFLIKKFKEWKKGIEKPEEQKDVI